MFRPHAIFFPFPFHNNKRREAEGDVEAKEMKTVMMAWYDNATRAGPLTYRTYDGRRKARFLDILSLFNRINISHLRISELQKLRREQTHDRVEYRQVRYAKETRLPKRSRVDREPAMDDMRIPFFQFTIEWLCSPFTTNGKMK